MKTLGLIYIRMFANKLKFTYSSIGVDDVSSPNSYIVSVDILESKKKKKRRRF